MKNLNKFGIKDMTQKHIVLGCRKIWHKAWNLWKEFSKGSFEVLSVLQSKYFSQNFLVQLCWALKFTGCKICHRENRETFQRDSSVKRFFVSSQPQQHIRILLMFIAKNLVILSPNSFWSQIELYIDTDFFCESIDYKPSHAWQKHQ